MKGLFSIAGWIIVLMVLLVVSYSIIVYVSGLGSQVGAEYWRRSGYYVAARTADSITNLANSDVDELIIAMNLEDVDSCSIEVKPDKDGGMVYATVVYKGKKTESASRFENGGMQIDNAEVNCKVSQIKVTKVDKRIMISGGQTT